MERKFYYIDEAAARTAHEANSMREYRINSVTAEYIAAVNEAYDIGEERKQHFPDEADRIDYLCDKYARLMAEWVNENSRVEAMCPSILISGAGNFPVNKKNKQNARRKTMMQKYNDIRAILDKIRTCGSGAIKSNDQKALEKLEMKITRLSDLQEKMKQANAFYRKNKTLTGCPYLSEDEISQINAEMAKPWRLAGAPFQPYELTNNSANIRRLTSRLEGLKKVKEAGTKEQDMTGSGIDGLKVIENADAMRIQFIFNEKPSEEARNILKKWSFKWAPSFSAWQRMLNDSGKYAAARVLDELKALN